MSYATTALICIIQLLLLCQRAFGINYNLYQESSDVNILKLPANYLTELNKKVNKTQSSLDKQTTKALDNLSREEKRMQLKLFKLDSTEWLV